MGNKHPKKFLFITTTNLVTNPRLLKELELVVSNGDLATVLLFELANWSSDLNKATIDSFPGVNFISLSASKSPFLPWFFSSLLEKILRFIPHRILPLWGLSLAVSKRSLLLLLEVRKIKDKYDWVIAHNPGSFYPAYLFSRLHNLRLGIDVEDYHPGETNNKRDERRMLRLMQCVLPHATYCSFAAPLIAQEIHKHLDSLKSPTLLVLNGFPTAEFIPPQPTVSQKIRLVWFSQNIDKGRGLEEVIAAVNEISQYVELHLIGSIKPSFEEKFLQKKESIFLYPPMPQKDLHKFLSTFDVGLATDLPLNKNRDIALTNKLIVYSQAGLVIAANKTTAQEQFLRESFLHYILMEPNVKSISTALLNLYDEKQKGVFDKNQQYMHARKFSWEVVSSPLLNEWGLK